VATVIRQGLPADVSLLVGGMGFGLLAGIAGGAYCAARPGTLKARALETVAVVFMCAPVYVVGLSLLLLFGAGIAIVKVGLSIPTNYVEFGDSPLRWAGSLLVPCVVLGLPLAAVCLRMMRSSMAEILSEDYLRTAMAKGLHRRTVIRRHAVPSAVAPVFLLTGVSMPIVVTNLVLIEQVFSIPGVFADMKKGIAGGDFELLFGLTAVAAGLVAVSSLVTELTLWWLDPRVRTQA
jgi:peptide/nickel transport system permease protein